MTQLRQTNNNEKKMRVSFDLDEVLFVSPITHKTEEAPRFPFNRIFKERLRLGTAHLIPRLQELGYEVWIYTSSFRSERYIKCLFRCYGVHFDGIVNGQRHEKEVQAGKKYKMPTKMPSKYRISLHIDDEAIVCTYGRNYGFNVYQLNAPDDKWEEKIIRKASEIKAKEERQAN